VFLASTTKWPSAAVGAQEPCRSDAVPAVGEVGIHDPRSVLEAYALDIARENE